MVRTVSQRRARVSVEAQAGTCHDPPMRPHLLALLAVAGCNEIWGLDRDVALAPGIDGPDGGPDRPRIRFTSQITKTTATGYVDAMLDYAPIDPPPVVQIGLVGGPLAPATYAPEGTIEYPAEYVGKPWRLLYTLADGIPHEVHWSPPEGDLVAHLVEPVFGRLDRAPVPPGSGYTITPIGSPPQHVLTRVFTTGVWTEGISTGTSTGPTFDYDFATKAVPMSGRLGAPEGAKGDFVALADFRIQNGCRVASGAAAFPAPDLVAGTHTVPAPQPPYESANKQVRLMLGGPAPIDPRLKGLLGARAGTTNISRMQYGYVPSLGVFGFSKPVPAPILDFRLPGPRMIAFANCPVPENIGTYQTEAFADPADIRDRFPPVVHVEVVNQRVRGATTLISGFSGVLTSSDYTFTSGFLVAAPVNIRLEQHGALIADLEDLAKEGDEVPLGADPVELVFDLEANPLLAADYFDVTLYLIEPQTGALALQRVYTITDRKLRIEPSFLLPASEYAFEVRAYRGRPVAARADFSVNTYPQYAATLFTRIFKTP